MTKNQNVEVSVSEKDGHKIYNIDIGNIPKEEAEQYLREVMFRYKKREDELK